jgi:hypothetical protein
MRAAREGRLFLRSKKNLTTLRTKPIVAVSNGTMRAAREGRLFVRSKKNLSLTTLWTKTIVAVS